VFAFALRGVAAEIEAALGPEGDAQVATPIASRPLKKVLNNLYQIKPGLVIFIKHARYSFQQTNYCFPVYIELNTGWVNG